MKTGPHSCAPLHLSRMPIFLRRLMSCGARSLKKLSYEFFKPATNALFHFVSNYCENYSTAGNLQLKSRSIRNIQ